MGNDDFVKEMCGLFVTQGAEQPAQLRTLCVDGDSDTWCDVSHALKGFAATVGADEIRSLCATAQTMRRASIAERETLFVAIEQAYRDVVNCLTEKNPCA
jgi:HPt (histidine-containing phosphotransfer) domain-containing protein